MKKFNIPEYYKSSIIAKVKAKRNLEDPRKKDFSPSVISFSNVEFIISRHFGFCYGVENAIEKSYNTIQANPTKRIFLLSEMIHNPEVNDDLVSQGVHFIQDTTGNQLIHWDEINSNDIVIIPAFGATVETANILKEKGIDIVTFNTTCPFVEKVWNRSKSLGEMKNTVIIHGKYSHEETKATFSHSKQNSPTLIVRDIEETQLLVDYIKGLLSSEKLLELFAGKYSPGFNPEKDLNRIGVVNQTTMLASETQEIADLLKTAMINKFGDNQLKSHFADTRDTLCYATNDNQSATLELLKTDADIALVVGGYNSSNTSHIVELLLPKFETFFIKNETEISSRDHIHSFNIEKKIVEEIQHFLPQKEKMKIIITSGASCPDATVDRVMQKIMYILGTPLSNSDLRI